MLTVRVEKLASTDLLPRRSPKAAYVVNCQVVAKAEGAAVGPEGLASQTGQTEDTGDIAPSTSLPISAQLGMHLTQVTTMACYLVRGNFGGLAMRA